MPSLKRSVRAGAAVVVALSGIVALPVRGAEAAHLSAGSVEVVNPAGGAPLSSGGSSTAFRLKLPLGAACAGDSANAGYRIQSYLVPRAVILDALKFDSSGPVPVDSQFRAPLFDTDTVPYVDQQTASAIPAGGPGPIIQPLPAFSFGVYDTSSFPFTPGIYNVGIACTLGAPGSATQLDRYWNTVLTITADATDPGPADIRFVVGAVPDAPVLTTVTPGDGSLTAAYTATASTPPTTSYTVTATPLGGAPLTASSASATSTTVAGLTNGTAYTVTVTATNSTGTSPPSNGVSGTPEASPAGPTFAPLSPFRIWDSRVGPGPVGLIGAGQSRNVTVTNVGGVPASGVTAVVLNVTAVNPSAATYVTAWPTGETKPLASNLNVPPADVRPNLVVVKVGAGGQVSFDNNAGDVHLIADVAGWYGPSGGQRYNPVSPSRVWDSRSSPGPAGVIGAGQSRNVTVTNVGGVPASGVTAVALNVTAAGPTASTWITAWPTGETKPLASNLNVPPGDVRPNLVIVKVGAGGQVSFDNNAGDVHLIADVAGWYGATGATLNSVSPARLWDSRSAPGPSGLIGPGQSRNVTVTGIGGVPSSGVTAVILNVTAVGPTASTWVTAWPAGETKPLASNLNVPPGDVRPNLAIVKVGAGGQVSFDNNAGDVHLIADVAGWYGTAGP